MNSNPFNITKEEVLELAATKLANQFVDEESLADLAEGNIRRAVDDLVKTKLDAAVEETLSKEMEVILSKEIIPRDIWGEPQGKPTTIRDQLAERARDFWQVKVDSAGKPSDWGGTPRHEVLMRKILAEEFDKSVRENATVIVAEFKKAILADSVKIVTEHINKLIK